MHDPSIQPRLSDRIFSDAPMCGRDLALAALLGQWDQQIKKRMASAAQEDTQYGRRFIEYGAVCIYNCAMELRQALEGHAGQAASDLGLEVVQQHAEGP